MPAAAYSSILHRISGMIMFLLLPFVVWLFDASVTSEVSFDTFRSAFIAGIGPIPGVLVKLVVLGLIWAYLHHFTAGVRHLWMDLTHSVGKEQGKSSAVLTMAITLVLTAALGAKLFALY